MKSLADALPPEIAQQIDPGWRRNEAAYWAVRDQLLAQFQGQWIGFADGAVIASGTSPVAVFHAAEATVRNPFVTCRWPRRRADTHASCQLCLRPFEAFGDTVPRPCR